MSIRPEVQELLNLGAFPPSSAADEKDVARRASLLQAISPPVSVSEAAALLSCFGPDETFGLAWELVHLIETAPGGVPIAAKPPASANEWVARLWDRARR